MIKTNTTAAMTVFVMISILMAFASTGCSQQPTGKVVGEETTKIGAVLSLTGIEAAQGELAKRGILLAENEINSQGGINGKKLKVVVEDSKSSAKEAMTGYTTLQVIHQTPIILSLGSPTAMAMAPKANEDQTILLAYATAPAYSSKGDYTFRIVASANKEAKQLAKIAYNDLGKKELVIIYSNNDYGAGNKAAFTRYYQAQGGNVTLELGFDPAQTDFRDLLLKVKEARPETVYFASWGKQAGIMARQSKEMGIENVQLLCGRACLNPDLIKEGGNAVEGLIFPEANINTSSKFYDDYVKAYGEKPVQYIERMYDATMISADLLKKCDQDTGCMREELSVKTWKMISTDISFDEYGDMREELVLNTVKDGKFVFY